MANALLSRRTGATEGNGTELRLRRPRSGPVVHYVTSGNSLPLSRFSGLFRQMRRLDKICNGTQVGRPGEPGVGSSCADRAAASRSERVPGSAPTSATAPCGERGSCALSERGSDQGPRLLPARCIP